MLKSNPIMKEKLSNKISVDWLAIVVQVYQPKSHIFSNYDALSQAPPYENRRAANAVAQGSGRDAKILVFRYPA